MGNRPRRRAAAWLWAASALAAPGAPAVAALTSPTVTLAPPPSAAPQIPSPPAPPQSLLGVGAQAMSDWFAAAGETLAQIGESASQAGWEAAIALGLNHAALPEPPPAADVAAAPPDDGAADDLVAFDPAPPPLDMAPLDTAPPDPPPLAAPPLDRTNGPIPRLLPATLADAPPARPATSIPAPPAPAAEAEPDPALVANLVFDHAARLPDGAYFVPKPTQRLFGVRTLPVTAADVRPSVKLPGRIVADPHVHGEVEASLLGRVEAPPSGLPVLGDRVARGQVLGFVTPAIGVVDRTQVRREVARLTNEIRQETEALARLGQLWFVPFRDGKTIQSNLKLQGLRRERDALLPMLQIREALRASIDGVVSRSTAILGRIVHPGEMIFEIVDPHSLWVEAAAPDPQVAELAAQAAEATASTPDGDSFALTFVGAGLTLEQQAAPLLLRIDDPLPGLRVGRPVTVTVRTNAAPRHGTVVPRAAVALGNDGIPQVWAQSAPERFRPYAVRTEDIDGASVLIVAGLPEGQRVVVQGIKLLTQLN